MNRVDRRQKAVGGGACAGACAAWAVVLALRATSSTGAQAARPGGSANRPTTDNAQAGLTITLRVYNYAHVAPAQLSRAEEEATAILRKAGVETAWVDCPLSGADLKIYPACQERMGAADFALRLRPSARTPKAAQGDTLGSALACLPYQAGCSAEVFCQRVADWAGQVENISVYQLLGHAMAHEIGHLLLGANSHSRNGIMRPQWNPRDLAIIARASMYFTPEQSAKIRVAVQARSERRDLATTPR
jgi:hypothetical protein